MVQNANPHSLTSSFQMEKAKASAKEEAPPAAKASFTLKAGYWGKPALLLLQA